MEIQNRQSCVCVCVCLRRSPVLHQGRGSTLPLHPRFQSPFLGNSLGLRPPTVRSHPCQRDVRGLPERSFSPWLRSLTQGSLFLHRWARRGEKPLQTRDSGESARRISKVGRSKVVDPDWLRAAGNRRNPVERESGIKTF